uniref:Acetoacetyl-CoA synthetase n=1 Tax=Acrobeloides nanus TaxID=290746 RepID=A0A914CLH2_9BILA
MDSDSRVNGFNGKLHNHVEFYIPSENQVNAELRLKEVIESKFHIKFTDYEEFYRWTCENYEQFWETVLIETNIKLSSPYQKVVEKTPNISVIPKWFVGSKLNYAENCLKNGRDGHIAFVQATTSETFKFYDYATLRRDVAQVSTSLRKNNVGPGDYVCGYLPNTYETAVAMLATATVGAAWSSASSDFGPDGVLDRFGQVKPKILFTVINITYKQKRYSLAKNVNEIVQGLPDLERVIIIPTNGVKEEDFNQFSSADKFVSWDKFKLLAGPSPKLEFEQVPFHHPLFVMFSSGTTGIPKGMVHTVGGTLLKHVEEHIYQTDMKPSDRILFYTTCGWMMWNWLMTVLFTGATIILYDESPLEPDPHVLLKICQNMKATIFGAGAKLFDEYAKSDCDFKSLYDLKSLRLILSTASPLKPNTFEFLNAHIRPQVCIGSICGGTDIIGCFMGACMNLPVNAGECQHFYLGMDMRAFNHQGKPTLDEQGELVCLSPFPSMPSHFVNDPDGAKYRKAYFEKYENAWTHGDYCLINSKTMGIVIFGRSDATLNRGGVRIGTAEIYNVVENFQEVQDSLVVGQRVTIEDDNENILLFLKLKNGHTLTDDLVKRIKTALRARMSPRHVPNDIHCIADIPYTNSGKKVELAVKQVLHGLPVQNMNSLRNPEALECFIPYRLK